MLMIDNVIKFDADPENMATLTERAKSSFQFCRLFDGGTSIISEVIKVSNRTRYHV